MATKAVYTYDSKTKRWRKNGKFSSKPRKSALRKNKAGKAIDSRGRVVESLYSKPKPKPKAKPKTKPKRAPKKTRPKRRAKSKPRSLVSLGLPEEFVNLTLPLTNPPDPPAIRPRRIRKPKRQWPKNLVYVPEGMPITEKALISSTFNNVSGPDLAHETLIRLVTRKAFKADVPLDDLMLYQYGVQFINTEGDGDLTQVSMLAAELAATYPELTFKFGDNSLHVLAGDTNVPVSLEPGPGATQQTAAYVMGQLVNVYRDVWSMLRNLWDNDLGWFVVAENESLTGGS